MIGVAAVDSSLESLFDVPSSIIRDDNTYAFLVNDAGKKRFDIVGCVSVVTKSCL